MDGSRLAVPPDERDAIARGGLPVMPETWPSQLNEADSRPGVCGYLRAETPNELEIAQWRQEIKLYCREQDFRLETIFVDRRVADNQVTRPGFEGLLDVLSMPKVIGVVVPNLQHLSSNNEVLAMLRRLIRRTNSEVVCIEKATDDFRESGA